MEDTRTRILKSALVTFSKQGYASATTREIARCADVTEVTLFRHFSSKEKLFEEVIHGFLPGPDFEKIVLEAKKLEYEKSLESIAIAFFNGLKQHESLIQVLYMECQHHSELMEKVYMAFVNNLTMLLASYFKELQEKKVIRDLNTTIIAKMFMGSLVGFYEEEFLFNTGKIGENIDEIVPICIGIFARGTRLTV